MPFIQIQPKLTRANTDLGNTKITMGAYLAEGIKRPKHISIRIPLRIIEETNFILTGRKTIVGLHEGVGSDTGFLMLYYTTNAREGSVATQSLHVPKGEEANGATFVNRQGFTVSFRFERFQYYAPNEWPISSTEVNHMIDNGNVIIECPDWLRPNVEKMKTEGLWEEEKEPEIKEVEVKLPDVKLNRQERRAVAAKITRHLR